MHAPPLSRDRTHTRAWPGTVLTQGVAAKSAPQHGACRSGCSVRRGATVTVPVGKRLKHVGWARPGAKKKRTCGGYSAVRSEVRWCPALQRCWARRRSVLAKAAAAQTTRWRARCSRLDVLQQLRGSGAQWPPQSMHASTHARSHRCVLRRAALPRSRPTGACLTVPNNGAVHCWLLPTLAVARAPRTRARAGPDLGFRACCLTAGRACTTPTNCVMRCWCCALAPPARTTPASHAAGAPEQRADQPRSPTPCNDAAARSTPLNFA